MHVIGSMSRRKNSSLKPRQSFVHEVPESDFNQKGEQMALSDEDALLIEKALPQHYSSFKKTKRIRILVHPRRKAA